MTTLDDCFKMTSEEASVYLHKLLIEAFLSNDELSDSKKTKIKALAQRLYGDYRAVHNTSEYKRAKKYVNFCKSLRVYKALL